MEKTKGRTGAMSLGGKGFVIVILSFLSCYLYSALTSDSLNITVDVFGAMGMSTTLLGLLPTIATICGIVGSVVFGIISEKRVSRVWAISMCGVGVFALIWSISAKTVSAPIYTIGYLVCYTLSLVCAMLLSFNMLANWFPRKRGVALGIATAGFPLSAATTTAVCSAFIQNIGMFYVVYGIAAIVIAIVIFVYAKDFPEEKGAYPDNDKDFDFETAKREHEASLEYLKTSKWTVKKCICTGRMWHLWLSVSITGFLCMGVMSNFFPKFMSMGYEQPQILVMLAVIGVAAIPGSIFTGWLDVKIGVRNTAVIINGCGLVVMICFLLPIRALHYVALPFLAIMLGGSSNIMTSLTAAIWGRYDFQNAFRVIQPLNALMTGVGISVVTIVGRSAGFTVAYIIMLVLQIIGFIAMLNLKVEHIDKDIR